MTTATCAALAGISVMTMMTTDQWNVPDAIWLDRPGIVIRAPHDVSPAGAIPLKIDVEADLPDVPYANSGASCSARCRWRACARIGRAYSSMPPSIRIRWDIQSRASTRTAFRFT